MDTVDGLVAAPLIVYEDSFRAWLVDQGYRQSTVRGYVPVLRHASRWLAAQGLSAGDLALRVEAYRHSRLAEGYSPRAQGLHPLVEYVSGLDLAPSLSQKEGAAKLVDTLLVCYRRYLVEQRGLSPQSVDSYVRVARKFLVHYGIDAEGDLAELSPGGVIGFVRQASGDYSLAYVHTITTRLRSLLRFLHVEGLTPRPLAAAVPSVAGWRLVGLPQGLEPSMVRRLLSSCDRRKAIRRRDYAILMILSRLGLRAGEVATLRLDDVDWRAGEITVHGKGNRRDRLPLPSDVGEAIVGWLRWGRPRSCAATEVFTRVRAPYRGLSASGVSTTVSRACKRAKVPPVGAHRLRHYTATQLLRSGSGLVEIGQVLRHRSAQSTLWYAKVDRHALSQVARPWPEKGGLS
jgi:integrase/recombinase XerD